MKKIILLISAFLFALSSNVIAQVPDECLECPDAADWVDETDNITLEDCPDCKITLEWRWRGGYPRYDPPTCNGMPIYEMEIISFIKDPACSTCTMHDREIFAELFMWMCLNYPFPQLYSFGDCYQNVSLIQVSCWKTINGITSVCPGSGCCAQKVKICKGQNGTEVYLDYTTTTAVDCDPDGGVTCMNFCGWVEYYDGLLDRKPIEIEKKEAEIENEHVLFKPNPSNGTSELSLNFEEKGLVNIKIISAAGTEVNAYEIDKTSDSETLDIDMSNYPSGMYYYIVELEGMPIAKGKFSLVK